MTSSDKAKGESDSAPDSLFDGRVLLKRRQDSHSATVDSIFLAASVAVAPGEFVLDAGAGVGTASLCLAARIPYCRVIGIERDKESVRMATDNVRHNGLKDRVAILNGDLANPPPRLAAGSYAQVISNPPVFETKRAPREALVAKKETADADVDLDGWVRFCLLMLRPGGVLTVIRETEALDRLLLAYGGKVGDIVVFPIWEAADKPASRVIVRGVKGSRGGSSLSRGLILRQADGTFSLEAEAILRRGEPLAIAGA